MLKGFGDKVKKLRQERGVTREELCGDEIELSVRQLARIESGQSLPTLSKVEYIAKQLNVSIGYLADGQIKELPKRYKELKYQILRTPTYLDDERLKIREKQFDEIFNSYYADLPEVEQVLIDIVQARFEVFNSENINFGSGVLNDYFEQVKKKKKYNINDLALIDLYLICVIVRNFNVDFYDEEVYHRFLKNLRNQADYLNTEDIFFLNKIYLMLCSSLVKKKDYVKLGEYLKELHPLILKGQDFQRMPLYYMYYWKYSLLQLENLQDAEKYYTQSIVFAEMIQDSYLVDNLQKEWCKDRNEA